MLSWFEQRASDLRPKAPMSKTSYTKGHLTRRVLTAQAFRPHQKPIVPESLMRPRIFSPYQVFLGEFSCIQYNLVFTSRQPWMGYPMEIQENVVKLPLHSQKYPQSYPGLCSNQWERKQEGWWYLWTRVPTNTEIEEASSPHREYCVELQPFRQVTSSLSSGDEDTKFRKAQ